MLRALGAILRDTQQQVLITAVTQVILAFPVIGPVLGVVARMAVGGILVKVMAAVNQIAGAGIPTVGSGSQLIAFRVNELDAGNVHADLGDGQLEAAGPCVVAVVAGAGNRDGHDAMVAVADGDHALIFFLGVIVYLGVAGDLALRITDGKGVLHVLTVVIPVLGGIHADGVAAGAVDDGCRRIGFREADLLVGLADGQGIGDALGVVDGITGLGGGDGHGAGLQDGNSTVAIHSGDLGIAGGIAQIAGALCVLDGILEDVAVVIVFDFEGSAVSERHGGLLRQNGDLHGDLAGVVVVVTGHFNGQGEDAGSNGGHNDLAVHHFGGGNSGIAADGGEDGIGNLVAADHIGGGQALGHLFVIGKLVGGILKLQRLLTGDHVQGVGGGSEIHTPLAGLGCLDRHRTGVEDGQDALAIHSGNLHIRISAGGGILDHFILDAVGAGTGPGAVAGGIGEYVVIGAEHEVSGGGVLKDHAGRTVDNVQRIGGGCLLIDLVTRAGCGNGDGAGPVPAVDGDLAGLINGGNAGIAGRIGDLAGIAALDNGILVTGGAIDQVHRAGIAELQGILLQLVQGDVLHLQGQLLLHAVPIEGAGQLIFFDGVDVLALAVAPGGLQLQRVGLLRAGQDILALLGLGDVGGEMDGDVHEPAFTVHIIVDGGAGNGDNGIVGAGTGDNTLGIAFQGGVDGGIHSVAVFVIQDHLVQVHGQGDGQDLAAVAVPVHGPLVDHVAALGQHLLADQGPHGDVVAGSIAGDVLVLIEAHTVVVDAGGALAVKDGLGSILAMGGGDLDVDVPALGAADVVIGRDLVQLHDAADVSGDGAVFIVAGDEDIVGLCLHGGGEHLAALLVQQDQLGGIQIQGDLQIIAAVAVPVHVPAVGDGAAGLGIGLGDQGPHGDVAAGGIAGDVLVRVEADILAGAAAVSVAVEDGVGGIQALGGRDLDAHIPAAGAADGGIGALIGKRQAFGCRDGGLAVGIDLGYRQALGDGGHRAAFNRGMCHQHIRGEQRHQQHHAQRDGQQPFNERSFFHFSSSFAGSFPPGFLLSLVFT